MEFISILSVVVMPFAVKYVTAFSKQLAGIPMLSYRVAIVRALVAIFSLAGAILSQSLGEGQVSADMVETTVLTVLNAGVATWLYLRGKASS